jgi:SdpC family antimicrobial peptide
MVNLPKQDPVRAAIATTGVGLVAAALIVGAAVPADATQHTRSVMPSAERHHRPGDAGTSATAQRGQQVFEALFFLQGGDRTRSLLGDAAVSSLTRNEIDSVLRAVSTPESVAKVKQIENELTASNPEYFGDLGATVLSGDPVQVQRYLTSAYDEMLRTPTMTEAVESLKSQETYVPGEVGTDCGIAVVVAVGAVLAVTAVAARA